MKNKVVCLIMMCIFCITMTNTIVYAVSNDKFTEADIKSNEWSQYVDEWEKIEVDYTKLSLSPGANESELNFAWYCKDNISKLPSVKIQKKNELENGKMTDSALIFNGTMSDAISGYKTNKVTVKGLEKNTEYAYCYGNGEDYSEVYYYTTRDTKKFKVLFVGDPQIGASCENISSIDGKELGNTRASRNDSFNWNKLITNAVNKNPNIALMISAGDQINYTASDEVKYREMQYSGLLYPAPMKSIPMATTIGNHDKNNYSFGYHFNNPNMTDYGKTNAGGDYYYTYGDVLFIVLNSNNTNISEHESFMKEVMEKNEDKKWKVVTMHHDIFGAGMWHSQKDSKDRREGFGKLLEKYNIDFVLSGHDHAYSRSYFISNIESSSKYTIHKEYENMDKVVNPEGLMFLTGNCSIGSKYYPVYNKSLDYAAKTLQGDELTYSIIDFSSTSVTINTYNCKDNKAIDKQTIIAKPTEKKALKDKVDEVNEIISKATEGNKKGNYPVGSKDELVKSTETAKLYIDDNNDVSQEQIDEEIEKIDKAISEFNSKIIKEDPIEIDKSDLKSKIEESEKILNKAKEGIDVGQYPIGSKKVLKEAIDKAKDIYAYSESQDEIDKECEELFSSLEQFKGEIITSSSDINKDEDKDKEDIDNKDEDKDKEDIDNKDEDKDKEDIDNKDEDKDKEDIDNKDEDKDKEDIDNKDEDKDKEDIDNKDEDKDREDIDNKDEDKDREDIDNKDEDKDKEDVDNNDEDKDKEESNSKNTSDNNELSLLVSCIIGTGVVINRLIVSRNKKAN